MMFLRTQLADCAHDPSIAVVDCDEDLTTKLITAMKTHEPMSVPKFKRFCAKVLNSHVSKWEKKMDAEFEERTKKMRKKLIGRKGGKNYLKLHYGQKKNQMEIMIAS